MKKQNGTFIIFSVGLAIFSMLFGAGNLMYPLEVGMISGEYTVYGMLGFLATSVCLPVIGLISMILFDGNYCSFFLRAGKITGNLFLFVCIVIIGPLLAIPRIVTLSHVMIAPFLPIPFLQEITYSSSFIFSLIFLGITFIATYRESKIIDLLGKVISPLLLLSLIIIIGKGFLSSGEIVPTESTIWELIKRNFILGYQTLDLLGAIFFASIVLTLLRSTFGEDKKSPHELAVIGCKAGLIGVSLLSLVYVGMAFLGMYHGHGLSLLNAGQLFREISFIVLGSHGAIIISTAVLMACFSTSIALSAVVSEYLQDMIGHKNLSYANALLLVLISSIPLSIFGLSKVLALAGGPLTYVVYPCLITLTVCNLLYKAIGFSWVKLPLFVTFVFSVFLFIG